MTSEQLFHIKWSTYIIALCVWVYFTLWMIWIVPYYDDELFAIFAWTAMIVVLFSLSKVPQAGLVASAWGGICATVMTIFSWWALEQFGMILVYVFIFGRIFYLFCLVTSGQWAQKILKKKCWEYVPKWRLRDTMMCLAVLMYFLAILWITYLPSTLSYGLELSIGLLFVIPLFIVLLSEYWKAFFTGILSYAIWVVILYIWWLNDSELSLAFIGSPVAFLFGVYLYILFSDWYRLRFAIEKK